MRDPSEVIVALRALLAKATPGEWMLATSCSWRRILTTDGKPVIVPTTQCGDNHPDMDCGDNYANAELAIAAVNALPELLAIAEAAEDLRADAMRLDYIERTFSGMTNRERYLPVEMIWGKGCNGRTLREACDKYMKRDAANAA